MQKLNQYGGINIFSKFLLSHFCWPLTFPSAVARPLVQAVFLDSSVGD